MRKMWVAVVIVIAVTVPGLAQGRGGGRGQSGRQRQAQSGIQSGRGQKEQDRVRTQQMDRLRKQIRDCSKSADRIRTQASRIGRMSNNGKLDGDKARRQNEQLRDRIRVMEQQHNRLMTGLDDNQRQAWQESTREMERLRQQLQERHLEMSEEMAKPDPDVARVVRQAQTMAQTAEQWQKRYRQMEMQAQP